LEDLNVGDILKGTISKIESFGVFISIATSSLIGLCHKQDVNFFCYI